MLKGHIKFVLLYLALPTLHKLVNENPFSQTNAMQLHMGDCLIIKYNWLAHVDCNIYSEDGRQYSLGRFETSTQ